MRLKVSMVLSSTPWDAARERRARCARVSVFLKWAHLSTATVFIYEEGSLKVFRMALAREISGSDGLTQGFVCNL